MTAPEYPRQTEGTRHSGGDGSSPDEGSAPINREPIAAWTRDAMQAMGFQGFLPFSALTAAVVPPGPGVYCVVRTITTGEPTFLPRSPAGHFKGKDPTAPVAELKQLWVTGSEVIYIGKAQCSTRSRAMEPTQGIPRLWGRPPGPALGWPADLAVGRQRGIACGMDGDHRYPSPTH